MNIIFAKKEDVKVLREKYVVLQLDMIKMPADDEPQIAWCIVDLKSIALQDMPKIEEFRDLHDNLIENYQKKNWNYCEQAIEHLMGRWNGNLDSFYSDLLGRVLDLKNKDLGPDWSPVIDR